MCFALKPSHIFWRILYYIIGTIVHPYLHSILSPDWFRNRLSLCQLDGSQINFQTWHGEHAWNVRLNWFTMPHCDLDGFNPRFNLLVQRNFHNLFQTWCHRSALRAPVSVCGKVKITAARICGEEKHFSQIISENKASIQTYWISH